MNFFITFTAIFKLVKFKVMKTKKFLLSLLAFMLLVVSAFSQRNPTPKTITTTKPFVVAEPTEITTSVTISGGSFNPKKYEGIPGDPYLIPAWKPGVLILTDNSRIDNFLFRYNLYTQQMQFINNADTLAIAIPEEINNLNIDDRTFIYSQYVCKNAQKKGYFELLEDGHCRLLKRWVILYHIIDEEKPEAEKNNIEDDIFIRTTYYYFKLGDEPAKKIPKRQKDILEYFGDKKQDVQKYMKNEGLKIKNEEDLIKIFAFYNKAVG